MNCKIILTIRFHFRSSFWLFWSHPIHDTSYFFLSRIDSSIAYGIALDFEFSSKEYTFLCICIELVCLALLACMLDMFKILFKAITADKNIVNVYPDQFA